MNLILFRWASTTVEISTVDKTNQGAVISSTLFLRMSPQQIVTSVSYTDDMIYIFYPLLAEKEVIGKTFQEITQIVKTYNLITKS